MAKDYFNSHDIKYTEYDVATDLERRKEMIDKTGQMGVPVIEIDGKLMVGFEESKLAELLGTK